MSKRSPVGLKVEKQNGMLIIDYKDAKFEKVAARVACIDENSKDFESETFLIKVVDCNLASALTPVSKPIVPQDSIIMDVFFNLHESCQDWPEDL